MLKMFMYIYGCPQEPWDQRIVFAKSREEADQLVTDPEEEPSDELSIIEEFKVAKGRQEGRIIYNSGRW